jgi:hypothetical protein
MKKILSPKIWTIVGILGALLLVTAFSVPQASASNGDFNLDVAHLINGKDLGLDKELPVDVYLNGNLAISNFTFGEKIATSLPAGWYTITVFLTVHHHGLPDGWHAAAQHDCGTRTDPRWCRCFRQCAARC